MQINIGVDLNHPINEVPGVKQEISPDDPQVCLPADWEAWREGIEESVRFNSLLQMRFSTTANSKTIAIAICADDPGADAFDLLFEGRRAFGFVADAATLRQLQGALVAALSALE